MSAAPLLSLERACVGWGRKTVLADVTFDIRSREWFGIVGPNGCGKTTLLRAILGLSAPVGGAIRRGGGWRAGYVPQRESLDPVLRLRAEEVVAMAAQPDAWLPGTVRRRRRYAARAALDSVGMCGVAERPYRDLSGGQRQRVLVARALVAEPTILVLDEPTNGMDVRAEQEMLALVRRLRDERGFAVLVVTHSLSIVADEADSVGLVSRGRLVAGPAKTLLTSASLSDLWGHPIRVETTEGRRSVRAERLP